MAYLLLNMEPLYGSYVTCIIIFIVHMFAFFSDDSNWFCRPPENLSVSNNEIYECAVERQISPDPFPEFYPSLIVGDDSGFNNYADLSSSILVNILWFLIIFYFMIVIRHYIRQRKLS